MGVCLGTRNGIDHLVVEVLYALHLYANNVSHQVFEIVRARKLIASREGLPQRKLVLGVAVYSGLCLIGTEFALFFACRPLSYYWAVPTPDCTSFYSLPITSLTQ
jgi:hypothetical protein